MKRFTIILLLLALVAAGLLYYWWRQPKPPAPGQSPSLISLLPTDASYIFFVDAAALRASPFVQQLLAVLPSPREDPEYIEFVRRSGFDYTRDLDRVAVAVRAETMGTIAIAEGRFDRRKITGYALETGQLTREGSQEVYRIQAGNPPKTTQLSFLADNRIAMFDGPAAEMLPTGVRPAANPAGRSELEERTARVAASELFAVARVGQLPKSLLPEGWVSKEIQEMLAGVRWVTLAIRPAPLNSEVSSLNVVLEAECETPTDAHKLAWSLEGLRVLARMALSDPKSVRGMDPALTALVQTILKDGKVTSADRYARLSFSLGTEFLAAIKQQPAPAPKKANR